MVLQRLAEVDKENLIKTAHFIQRIDLRQEDNFPDEDEIITIILSKEPVGVLK